jgi:hypothetical protein
LHHLLSLSGHWYNESEREGDAMSNYDKMAELVASNGCISVSEIKRIMTDNLKVIKVEVHEYGILYFVTRLDKSIGWPVCYEAAKALDGQDYHCTSYGVADDRWPKDTQVLKVYRI